MPRHDRSYGVHHSSRQKGGNASRRTRTPRNTYAAKQHRHLDPSLLGGRLDKPLVIEYGRHDGNTNKGGSTPQKPKDQPKGGSKPGGTVRRRTRAGAEVTP